MIRALAAALAVTLAAAGIAESGPGESGGGSVAVAGLVVVAILLTWATGSAGPAAAPGGWRKRVDRWTTAGLAVSLAAGAGLAATLDGVGPYGLPAALWALVIGVFVVPLVLTSVGSAVSFEPPSDSDLERLRAGAPDSTSSPGQFSRWGRGPAICSRRASRRAPAAGSAGIAGPPPGELVESGAPARDWSPARRQ